MLSDLARVLGSPLVTWSDFKVGDACFGQLPEGDDHGLLYIGQPALHIAPSLQPLENRRSPNGRVDIAIKYTVAMQLLELQAIKPARMFDAPHQIIFPVTFCRGTFSCSGESIARISLVNTGGPPGSAGGPLANSNLQCSNLLTHSLTTHSLTHSLTHPPTHSLTHPPTHSLTHSYLFSPMQDEWLTCQRNWLYLESIFGAPDIQRQLPNEAKMFSIVDKSWKEIMRRVHKVPLAIRAGTQPGT